MGWFTKRESIPQTPETLRAAWEATEQAERAQRQAEFEKWFHGKLVPIVDAGLRASALGEERPSEWNVGTYGFTIVKNNLFWYKRPGVTVYTCDQYVSERLSPHYEQGGYQVEVTSKTEEITEQQIFGISIIY